MPTYAHPGVYIEELPSGVMPIEGVGTSTAAFLGFARKGPVDAPMRITKWDDYEDFFGGVQPHDSTIGHDLMGHSVSSYFTNGGTVAYIVRLADNPATASGSMLHPTDNTVLLTFKADDGGAWANSHRILVVPKSSGLYTIAVEREEQIGTGTKWVQVEQFDNVSLDPKDSNYIKDLVDDQSLFGVTAGSAMNYMFGESRSGSLANVAAKDANDSSMTVKVNGTSRTVTFGATEFTTQDTLTKVASTIESKVRGTGGTPPDAQKNFTCQVVNNKLILRSGAAGTTSAVVVTGPNTKNAAIKLQLGEANGGDEVTGAEALAEVLSSAVDPTTKAIVVKLAGGSDGTVPQLKNYQDALARLRPLAVNTICLPGIEWGNSTDEAIIGAAIDHAEDTMSRMVIVDLAHDVKLTDESAIDGLKLPTSTYAVTYHPWLEVANPYYHPELAPGEDRLVRVPPSGFAAGMWGKIDGRRGVWKAPAGTETGLLAVAGVVDDVEDLEQDFLNPLGINCIRNIPGFGFVIWGARTRATKSNPEWRYVPVRRTAIFLERSIYGGIQWAVFEPNSTQLWSSLRANIGSFMDGLFRSGAFQGDKASDAYFVRCGLGDTMTQGDIDRGQVIVMVGFAPLKPAEFVIIRIQQKVGQQ